MEELKKTVYELSREFYTELLDSSMSIFQGAIFFIIIINDEFMVSGEMGGKTEGSHVTCLPGQSGGSIARNGAEQHKEVRPLAYLPQVGLLDLPSARA